MSAPLRRRLEAWARQSPPAPTESFVDDLESRMRMVTVERARPRPRRALVPAFAVLGLVVLALVLSRTMSPPPESTGSIELLSARDALVDFPDGTRRSAAPGLVVPEGALIRTGDDGRVVADGFVLGPRASAVVRDGRLVGGRVRRDRAPARPVPDAEPVTPDPSPLPPRSPRPAPVAPARTTAPDVTARPAPTPEALDAVRLTCRGVTEADRRGIECRWSTSEHERFASYRLWRSADDRRTVVFRTDRRELVRYFDGDVRAGQTYTYKVEAVDAQGRVIGSSEPVRVATPSR